MSVALPLDKMTLADKLAAMETLWEDLSHRAGDIAVPDWHYEILADRETAVREGQEEFVDRDVAKDQLRQSTKNK